jgi:lysophospholipase L1-like esterase
MEKEVIFVCLGDSLTAGSPGFSGYGAWSGNLESQFEYWLDQKVKADFPEIHAEILNYGVGGDVIEQMQIRYNRDVLFQLDKVDYVLIMGGNNDVVWRGAFPEEAIAVWEELYIDIVKSGAKVIALEILPVSVDHERVEKVKATNRGIHELGEKYNFPVVDLYDALADATNEGLDAPYDSGDGEHLSVNGYKKVGETIYENFLEDFLLNELGN